MSIISIVISIILLTGLALVIKEDRELAEEENTEVMFGNFEILCCVILSVLPVTNILFLTTIIVMLIWKLK